MSGAPRPPFPEAPRDGQVKVVGGIITGLTRRYTRRGELMATFQLEDLRGSIEVFVFPKVMQVYGALLGDDGVVVVKGRVDTRDEQVKLVCMELSFPTLVPEGTSTELRLRLPTECAHRRAPRGPEGGAFQSPWGRAGLLERGPDDPPPPGRVQCEQRSGPARRAGRVARSGRSDPRTPGLQGTCRTCS